MGLPLGARIKLLKAISALVSGAEPIGPALAAPPSSPPADTAERRQVTVMFSDLVGSTALSASMDPEDLREVISAYQKCVAETVRRFGGFVAKYMGDGVLVYFGYPQAHEDDAERAVRAGLELIEAVSALKSSASLQTRVGIATGLVVVGDLIGSGRRRSAASSARRRTSRRACKGSPSRTRSSSAESTRRLARQSVRAGGPRAKGPQGHRRAGAGLGGAAGEFGGKPLRGAARDRPDRPRRAGRRIRTAAAALVEEQRPVKAKWCLLSGEAGIGKSRLTAALLERLASEPHTRLRYFCSPQHTDSAFYPIIGQMERAAGLAHDDTPQAKLDKLDALLAQTSTSIAGCGTLCRDAVAPERWTLSRARSGPAAAPAKNAGSAHFTTARRWHAQNPVLMIFEDAHWTDPTSLEVFGRVVDRIRDPSRAADRDVPAGIRSALDRTAARDGPHHQSAGASAKSPP